MDPCLYVCRVSAYVNHTLNVITLKQHAKTGEVLADPRSASAECGGIRSPQSSSAMVVKCVTCIGLKGASFPDV